MAEYSYFSLQLLILAYLTWWAFKVTRRLFFHPLSAFPGPKAAAATTLYKTYIELVLKKSIVIELKELHDKYGKIPAIAQYPC